MLVIGRYIDSLQTVVLLINQTDMACCNDSKNREISGLFKGVSLLKTLFKQIQPAATMTHKKQGNFRLFRGASLLKSLFQKKAPTLCEWSATLCWTGSHRKTVYTKIFSLNFKKDVIPLAFTTFFIFTAEFNRLRVNMRGPWELFLIQEMPVFLFGFESQFERFQFGRI